MKKKIIAVDFDGTLCEDKWPAIGEPHEALFKYLLNARAEGASIILWTCRTNELLIDAIEWCLQFGLYFDAVNENTKETSHAFGRGGAKVYADQYIDDKAYHDFNLPFRSKDDLYSSMTVYNEYDNVDKLNPSETVLFAALCNTFSNISWKSKFDVNGKRFFDGKWFVVGLNSSNGTYKYFCELTCWHDFKIPTKQKEENRNIDDDTKMKKLLSLGHGSNQELHIFDEPNCKWSTYKKDPVRMACDTINHTLIGADFGDIKDMIDKTNNKPKSKRKSQMQTQLDFLKELI